jgi:hypothetical protein
MFDRAMLAATLVLCAVGVAGAVDEGESDLAAVFGAVAAIGAVLLIRTFVGRVPVALRADLVRWMAARAVVAGERTEDVADRAVAAYRDGLTGEDHDREPTRA